MATDKRHQKRIDILQKLFPLGFEHTSTDPDVQQILANLKVIDEQIQQHAPRYPLKDISKVDLAVLRLAMFELYVEKVNPPKVIIDEAVTLAREFGNEKSFSFVNGVLGSVLSDMEKHTSHNEESNINDQ